MPTTRARGNSLRDVMMVVERMVGLPKGRVVVELVGCDVVDVDVDVVVPVVWVEAEGSSGVEGSAVGRDVNVDGRLLTVGVW